MDFSRIEAAEAHIIAKLLAKVTEMAEQIRVLAANQADPAEQAKLMAIARAIADALEAEAVKADEPAPPAPAPVETPPEA